MVRGQSHGMHNSGGGSPLSKQTCELDENIHLDPCSVFIPVVVPIMSVSFNNGCDFVNFIKWCFIPHVLPYGSDVFVEVRFKTQGWDETGLHVGSACCFGSSISSLITSDAHVAR